MGRFRLLPRSLCLATTLLAISCLALMGSVPGCSRDKEPSEADKWEKLLVAPTENTNDRWQEAYVRFRDNQRDTASADEVRRYAQNHPDDQNGMMAAAIVERDSERFEEAELRFLNVIALNPQRTGALWNLGRLELRKPDEARAADYFERAMKADPQSWQPFYSMSLLRRQQGKKQEAEELWKRAKELGAGRLGERGGMGAYKVDLGRLLSDLDWE